ncbi:RNA-metabolising metallo-beta-lactamase [Staphylococcus arlettae]|nr:RNA-metabolising metallo-beta-lactamase [Staphylococcus arlettae]PTH23042.1 RNA-metabolising metallo-beta-lactamase [Staphylococcus arlettae]PTH25837.1 RNA-metabolising metallo-beta-lactamase [Staphylococcus arlettae]PTH35880.1 RNA-metabolising metallo-beta-lactamase [Staphylococcus arlettae]PTH47459.1 RNA-metabolising metallo-beta-lactamase [Staphylococcus arlettae]
MRILLLFFLIKLKMVPPNFNPRPYIISFYIISYIRLCVHY